MTIPNDISVWAEHLVPWLLFGATSGWCVSQLSKLAPHSVCLSGQRAEDKDKRTIWYRFAVQNNEDVCLTGKRKLIIAILDDGCFLDSPKLFIGRNELRPSMDDARKVLTLEFCELPAYDTWSIVCKTCLARTLSLSIEDINDAEIGSKPADGKVVDAAVKLLALPAVLSHSQLTISRDRDTAFEGAAFTPEFIWAAVATVGIALLPYLLYAYFRSVDWWDLAPLSALTLFGLGLWYAMRCRTHSIMQGYWTGTKTIPNAPGAGAARGAPGAVSTEWD